MRSPRRWLPALAIALAPAALAHPAGARPLPVVEIRMTASPDGTPTFDPVGVHVQPGQTVRWIQVRDVHSCTAYAPSNGHHQRRIPASAKAWDSGYLTAFFPAAGSRFEHRFVAEGVYDYYCSAHEAVGMVGRIVVGHPGATVARPFAPLAAGETPVPEAARRNLPTVATILAHGTIHPRVGVASR